MSTSKQNGSAASAVKDSANTENTTTTEVPAEATTTEVPGDAAQTQVTGRSVFAIETTAAGVVVRTAFMTEDNRLLDMPMVFPDAMYAFNVIDDLKRQVAEHFGRAARVGAQVIAQQAQAAAAEGNPDGAAEQPESKA